ncbi:MAG: hypothetical protein ACFFG0_19160 [Candidatus Thorarchaeota archaeon]
MPDFFPTVMSTSPGCMLAFLYFIKKGIFFKILIKKMLRRFYISKYLKMKDVSIVDIFSEAERNGWNLEFFMEYCEEKLGLCGFETKDINILLDFKSPCRLALRTCGAVHDLEWLYDKILLCRNKKVLRALLQNSDEEDLIKIHEIIKANKGDNNEENRFNTTKPRMAQVAR